MQILNSIFVLRWFYSKLLHVKCLINRSSLVLALYFVYKTYYGVNNENKYASISLLTIGYRILRNKNKINLDFSFEKIYGYIINFESKKIYVVA